MKWVTALIALMAVTPIASAQSPATSSAAAITLVDLERLAVESNPTTHAAQARVDAARARARQAGAWPNPIVGVTAQEMPFRNTEPHSSTGLFIDQTILLGGKLRLGRAVFDRTVERSEAELELQRQRVLGTVRRLFYQSLTTDRRIEVQERLAALASEAVAITSQLFNVGAADRPDFLESEIEAKRVQLDLNAAKNHSFALRQQLAAVVGNADIAARPLTGSVDEALPELTRTTALRTLIDDSPQIRAARAEFARAQALTALAVVKHSRTCFCAEAPTTTVSKTRSMAVRSGGKVRSKPASASRYSIATPAAWRRRVPTSCVRRPSSNVSSSRCKRDSLRNSPPT